MLSLPVGIHSVMWSVLCLLCECVLLVYLALVEFNDKVVRHYDAGN